MVIHDNSIKTADLLQQKIKQTYTEETPSWFPITGTVHELSDADLKPSFKTERKILSHCLKSLWLQYTRQMV